MERDKSYRLTSAELRIILNEAFSRSKTVLPPMTHGISKKKEEKNEGKQKSIITADEPK